ncbi:MAG: hypothetical protein GC160_12355 [Acidobacteria bacterium]|nr:hypothetical protein [Acidobacteriota bacterium]
MSGSWAHRGPVTRWVPPLLAAGVVAWLNLYIVRELFSIETTARMHSMHGFWTALARLGGQSWLEPTWWPYWDGGMPFEYAYAPLLPGTAALLSRLPGVDELRAVQIVFGLILVLGPTLLYLGVWRLTGSATWSFVAAVFYSLFSPALLLAPNQSFGLQELFNSERFYVVIEWDDGPHMTALALWPLAVLSLFRLFETRRWSWLAGGVLVMSAMVYASAFGATILAISTVCVLGALGFTPKNMALAGLAGALTYLGACAWLPPSFVRVIREASDFHGQGWTVGSWTALALIALAWAVVRPWLMRRVADSRLRFFVLFSLTCLLIVWLFEYGGRQFVPLPGRYKMELAVGLSLTAAFALRLVWSRPARPFQVALALTALAFCAEQTVSVRRWAKTAIVERDITATIEWRIAQAVDANLAPGEKVFLPGSAAQWLNAFSEHLQWSGGSWSAAFNLAQQRARDDVYQEVGDLRRSMAWFRSFGVSGVVVGGPDSPEFWKPFVDPGKYEGHFEELWADQDTTLYRVPLRTTSLAHALPAGSQTTEDWATVLPFAAALQAERMPGLQLSWEGVNEVRIAGEVRPGEIVAVQINHHPGWMATVGDREVRLEKDGLGQMWLQPGCDGDCSIRLRYTGGAELWACRGISAITLLGMFGLLLWDRGAKGGRPRRIFSGGPFSSTA